MYFQFDSVYPHHAPGIRLYPSHQLNSPKLKQALTENLLHPLTQHASTQDPPGFSTQHPPSSQWNIHTFRIVWGHNQPSVDADAWNELVRRRAQLDEHLAQVPEVGFFLSAITASYSHIQSSKKKVQGKSGTHNRTASNKSGDPGSVPNRQHTVRPIVAYWMYVHPQFNMADLHQSLHPLLEGGVLKNPIAESLNDPEGFNETGILHALYFACKDYKNTFIAHKVQNSALWCTGFREHPVIKLVVTHPGLVEQIQNAQDELSKAGLNSTLECKVQTEGTGVEGYLPII